MSDRIFIRDLRVRCIVGARPAERIRLQELVINVIITADLSRAAAADDLACTIDYAALASRLAEHVRRRRACLLETLAGELAALILRDGRAAEVTVRLEKPGALAQAAAAGVELTRTRPAAT